MTDWLQAPSKTIRRYFQLMTYVGGVGSAHGACWPLCSIFRVIFFVVRLNRYWSSGSTHCSKHASHALHRWCCVSAPAATAWPMAAWLQRAKSHPTETSSTTAHEVSTQGYISVKVNCLQLQRERYQGSSVQTLRTTRAEDDGI